jgi:hypothetical protein
MWCEAHLLNFGIFQSVHLSSLTIVYGLTLTVDAVLQTINLNKSAIKLTLHTCCYTILNGYINFHLYKFNPDPCVTYLRGWLASSECSKEVKLHHETFSYLLAST